MTEKLFTYDNKQVAILKDGEFWLDGQIDTACNNSKICNELNALHEEKEYLKTRFHEERELAMRLSRECDTLTIKKQELELEIIRLETIIRTGDDG